MSSSRGLDPALGVADPLGLGQGDRAFEDVERRARVAPGQVDEVVEGLVGEVHPARRPELAREAALRVGERPPDDRRRPARRQRLEAPDAQPRQQRRVDLEVGVLGRRADEGDRAVLDVGQQGVLLGLVEAVDLVDEQDGPAAVERSARSCGAGDDRARTSATPLMTADSVVEPGADRTGEQPGEARLAGPRRAPQQQRAR